MDLTRDDVISILKMIDESPLGRFALEVGELKMEVAKGEPGGAALAPQPRPAPAPVPAPDITDGATDDTADVAAAAEEGLEPITAPVLGMFYRRPEPSAPPYVEEGSVVEEDTTVALIEVMKLFNPVKAGVKGRVRRICVDNGALVEFGQNLFLIEPLDQPS
ncbi:MAG: biotin/lipoyl-containing protein [Rhodospirillales bacterium]|jgi:acetyl-CoA carboxylase biotin carboxyl carrier protein|nr:biotin/lipoyl-containing protein [Rhodospirillales bacterium]MDP6643760.1 biotin/lipoyl-containing protein [Rhodospirillales bacterium]MDP6842116.1 biotin/lipoyl-containing protein [Rhodospirillales bacterium]|tara:strand:+ start:1123 stop:1608 length:486 start_codon:yes stop_codon:yes gene_type:complete